MSNRKFLSFNFVTITVIISLFMVSSCGIGKEKQISEAKAKSNAELEFKYLYAEAGKAYMFGNLKQASELYYSAIQKNPASAASNYYLAKVNLELNDLNTSYIFSSKAVSLNKNNIWYSILFADICVGLERYIEAKSVLDEALTLFPRQEIIYNRLNDLYIRVNDFPRLLANLEKMQKVFGYDNDRALQIYDLYIGGGDFPSAESEVLQLIKQNPNILKYQALLAEFYAESFKKEQAYELYQNLLQKAPNDALIHLSYASFAEAENDTSDFLKSCAKVIESSDIRTEDKLKLLTGAYENSNLLSAAQFEDFLNQLLEQEPDSYLPNLYYADYLLNTGAESEAIIYYRMASKALPNDLNLAISVFELEYETANFEALFEDADFFSELYPNNAKVYLYKGISALMTKRFSDAEQALIYGKDLAFDDTKLTEQFYSYLAENYALTGSFANAEKYYEKVLAINPLNCSVSASYARLLAYAGVQFNKAEQLVSTCKDSYSEDATFGATYALVLLMKNEQDNALREILKLYNNQPDNIYVLEIYGDILSKSGQADKALIFWQKSKQNGNISPVLEKKIAKKMFLNK